MKSKLSVLLAGCLLCLGAKEDCMGQQTAGAKKYEVAAYYFPDYHIDSINERWHGKDWTEWEVLKAAKPRFPGHEQPKIPSWGYFDEADPKWAAKEIDLASSHGIDVFIYDWYWYAKTGQYLQEGLEKGFLKAPNRSKMKFALMWANHDWFNIHPAPLDDGRVKLTEGKVSWALWDTISTYIVENYFKQPNYWKIDGKPYFSIYEIITFINGLGGIETARKAMDLLEEKTKRAGLPGVHFNIMSCMVDDKQMPAIRGKNAPATAGQMLQAMGCNSVSTYCYIHHYTNLKKDGFPSIPYEKAFASAKEYWTNFTTKYPGMLYTPNISMGWDASPRCMQSDRFEMRGYPWTPVLTGNTPAAFEKALEEAKHFLDVYNPAHKIVVLNSWNEWTEGSYLLPEQRTGTGYLDAVKKVFGNGGQRPAVGAIRWDAWIGDFGEGLYDAVGVGLQVERALSPHQYHYRAPFFSKEISYDSIQCRGNTQAIMDKEIAYAKDAGIDYWAFCWYPFHSGLDTARTLYLASKHANDIKWCVILGTNPFRNESDAPWLVERFKEDNYQKVAGGRPLIYVFQKLELKTLDRIRELCKAERIPAPYVAVMDFDPHTAKATAESLKADALSSYKSAVGKNGEPYYPVIPKGDSLNWERYKTMDLKVIPWVTAGRNTKPRIERPSSWAKVPADQWVSDGTPEQIADDLRNSLRWVDRNRTACEANAIIIYAWNEFDEGGWICPTFGNNTARLEAIKKILKNPQ